MPRLTELNPRFVSKDGVRTGFSMLCPKCRKQRVVVYCPPWSRSTDDFEKLSMQPSVNANPDHAHFNIDAGEVKITNDCKATCNVTG